MELVKELNGKQIGERSKTSDTTTEHLECA